MRRILYILPNESLLAIVDKGEVITGYYDPLDIFECYKIITPFGKLLENQVSKIQAFFKARPIGQLGILGFIYELLMLRLSGKWKISGSCCVCYHATALSMVVLLACRVFGLRGILSFHSAPQLPGRSKGLTQYARESKYFVFSNCAALLATRVRVVYKSGVNFFAPVIRKKITIVYNIVTQLPEFKETHDYKSAKRFIYVGRNIRGRNLMEIIRYFRGSACRFDLTVVGSKPDLSHDVRNISVIPSIGNLELIKLMRLHDVLIVGSYFIELPKPAIEAFANGIPVLMNMSLYTQLVANGEILSSMCIPYEDGLENFHSIRLDSDRLIQVSEAARIFYNQNFSKESQRKGLSWLYN